MPYIVVKNPILHHHCLTRPMNYPRLFFAASSLWTCKSRLVWFHLRFTTCVCSKDTVYCFVIECTYRTGSKETCSLTFFLVLKKGKHG